MTPTPFTALETIRGTFRNQIRTLEQNMPRADSGGYVPPTKAEQADFSKLVSLIISNQLADTVLLAEQNNYTLNYYVDRGDEEATSYLLREKRPIEKGWGLYAIRLDSSSKIIVEAPHPLFDQRTPSVALDIYRALDARALLIAGAHRNANGTGTADAAHKTDTIFHTVHETLSRDIAATSGDVVVLQIHGYHTSKHNGYPEVVIGFGREIQPVESLLAQKLEAALTEQGISVGVCTGDIWLDLCAETNVQAAAMEGGAFLHLEMYEELRRHDDALIEALLEVFGR
jgi:hypothetical protein